MNRTRYRALVVFVCVAIMMTVFVSTAWAGFVYSEDGGLVTEVTGRSSTNPGLITDMETWWRGAWGKSLTPDFEVDVPSTDPLTVGMVVGMLYTLDRSPGTVIDVTRPQDYSRSARGSGTNLNGTVDVLGVLNYPPSGSWPAPDAGAVLPGESRWYLHFSFFTSMGFAGPTWHVPVGIDMTAPRAVNGLIVSPSFNPADAGNWSSSSRAHVSWTPAAYDDLSQAAYYQVSIDDVAVIPDSDVTPSQGRVYEIPGYTPSSITVENMPPGKHKVSINVVDRATNTGTPSSAYFYSDPDVPTVKFTKPSGAYLTPQSRLAVEAKDLAGISKVVYAIDGVPFDTVTSAPFGSSKSLAWLSAGPHTITATAYDMVNRAATVTASVTYDPVPLVISKFSRTPSIFYPIRRDRYKDNSTIYYAVNKRSSVTLTIRDASGNTVRTYSASAKPGGRRKFVWNGKWSSDGKAHKGKFTYQITATDVAGNSVSTRVISTTIRNYQLKKISKNKVKVIPR